MKCNIDARGKATRLRGGMLGVGFGLVVAALIVFDILPAMWWWVAGFMIAAGAFGIWEARKGWCAMRAMGIKTRV